MLKKLQKEISITTKCESEYVDQNNPNVSESYLSSVIGSLNVKRWNSLKTLFSCTTNENFVTKLLDIAQQHSNRKDEAERGKNSRKKVTRKPCRNKTKTDFLAEKDKNKSKENVGIISQNAIEILHCAEDRVANGCVTDEILTLKTKVDKCNPVTKVVKITEYVESCKKIKDLDVCKAPDVEVQTDETAAKSTGTLDIIKINLCQCCNTHHIQDRCPINFPNYIINDNIRFNCWLEKYKPNYQCTRDKLNNYINEKDIDQFSYSVMSLPDCLCIDDTNTVHGLGIFAKNELEPFAQLGPLIGPVVKEMDIPEDINMKYIWEINTDKGNIYIDTENEELSNWARYVRPAPNRDEKNVTVISKDRKLYFVTVKFIQAGEELLYWQSCPISTSKKKMEKTTCGGCNMAFNHPQYYRIHCSLFHDVRYSLTIKKYHCKVCGEAVLGKENIMKHAAELHNGQGAYQCQFCKKFFLRLNYLEMHRTYGCSQNPHRARPLCDFCGKKFCQPQKLKVHIKRMHSDISEVLKEFQCKNCLKVLGSRAALQRHAKEVHQKQTEGQCSCSVCGKRFQNNSNLKIHMLTHSGIKPFRCTVNICQAAFTTKQCLQFHYKKMHNLNEENMPKIQRSIDYTFQAYSGLHDSERNADNLENVKNNSNNPDDGDTDVTDNDSLNSENMDDPDEPEQLARHRMTPEEPPSPNHHSPPLKIASPVANMKVLTKGSKKWIADSPPSVTKLPDTYSDIYDRNKDFSRHEASNASLLVEAALDSVCNEPNIDIDVSTTPTCTDTLVNNLYNLAQHDNLPYSDSRDINLMSPSVHDQISVDDENIAVHYSNFHTNNFSPPRSPDVHRSNFVRNYINSLSPHPVPSPPRYDFGHVNPDHLSSDDSNGMVVQNLSLNKPTSHDYLRKIDQNIDVINESELSGNIHLESDNNKEHHLELDLDVRLKTYDNIDGDTLRLRNHTYDNDLEFRCKAYDVIEADFRITDRNFEPLVLNSSELQGLDMSARSFHNYSNLNRYHHLYPDDLRLNYSPPPPAYAHADILRVVSLDLTPPGRHSVDLSLRNHPLHQIPHRLLDQSRLLSADLTSSRHLTDHTTSRLLNTEQLSANHLLSSEQERIMNEEPPRLVSDPSRLIGDGRILQPPTPSGSVSPPVQGFVGGYSVSQNPYHPTPITARPLVASPTPLSYHYSSYY